MRGEVYVHGDNNSERYGKVKKIAAPNMSRADIRSLFTKTAGVFHHFRNVDQEKRHRTDGNRRASFKRTLFPIPLE